MSPNPGKCSGCGRFLGFGRTPCRHCGESAWRDVVARTIRAAVQLPCLSCGHREECPESSEFAFSCYYQDHPEVTPLT